MSNLYTSNPPKYSPRKLRFVAIEGIDGCGKTTVASLLAKMLRYQGLTVLESKEPGEIPGTMKNGTSINRLLTDSLVGKDPRIAQLLIEAARIEHLHFIEDWLRKNPTNSVYLVDRHADSTWAYQGALGVSDKYINDVQDGYSDLIGPDITIFIDVYPNVAEERRLRRAAETGKVDELDRKPLEFYESVIGRYWTRINQDRDQYYVLQANIRSPEKIAEILHSFFNRSEFK